MDFEVGIGVAGFVKCRDKIIHNMFRLLRDLFERFAELILRGKQAVARLHHGRIKVLQGAVGGLAPMPLVALPS